jgi:hypothetical protein
MHSFVSPSHLLHLEAIDALNYFNLKPVPEGEILTARLLHHQQRRPVLPTPDGGSVNFPPNSRFALSTGWGVAD